MSIYFRLDELFFRYVMDLITFGFKWRMNQSPKVKLITETVLRKIDNTSAHHQYVSTLQVQRKISKLNLLAISPALKSSWSSCWLKMLYHSPYKALAKFFNITMDSLWKRISRNSSICRIHVSRKIRPCICNPPLDAKIFIIMAASLTRILGLCVAWYV